MDDGDRVAGAGGVVFGTDGVLVAGADVAAGADGVVLDNDGVLVAGASGSGVLRVLRVVHVCSSGEIVSSSSAS